MFEKMTDIERLRSDLAFLRNYYGSIGNNKLSEKYQRCMDENPLPIYHGGDCIWVKHS